MLKKSTKSKFSTIYSHLKPFMPMATEKMFSTKQQILLGHMFQFL